MANELCMNCFSVKGPYEVCRYCGYVEGTPPEQPHYLRPGTVLKGHFIVGTAIGVGGFGITYKCYDATLGVIVAIKEFFPVGLVNRSPGEMKVGLLSGEKEKQYKNQIKRFLMEAQSIAQFGKANDIVNVFDYFEENNTAYIVMEYIDGVLLKDYLEKQGALSPDIAMTIIEPVVEALKKIHASGIIHRDISPDNIFIAGEDSVKVFDFGAAILNDESGAKEGEKVIKVGYSAPEQYRDSAGQGYFTDIYSIGAILYQMITGQKPIESTEREYKDELKSPLELGFDIEPNLDRAIMEALAVQPALRFQGIQQFDDAINGKRKAEYPKVKLRIRKRKRIMVACMSLLALAAIGVGGLFFNNKIKHSDKLYNENAKIEKATDIVVWVDNDKMKDTVEKTVSRANMKVKSAVKSTKTSDGGQFTKEQKAENPKITVEVKNISDKNSGYKDMDAALKAAKDGKEKYPDMIQTDDITDITSGEKKMVSLKDNVYAMLNLRDYSYMSAYSKYYPDMKQMPTSFDIVLMYALKDIQTSRDKKSLMESRWYGKDGDYDNCKTVELDEILKNAGSGSESVYIDRKYRTLLSLYQNSTDVNSDGTWDSSDEDIKSSIKQFDDVSADTVSWLKDKNNYGKKQFESNSENYLKGINIISGIEYRKELYKTQAAESDGYRLLIPVIDGKMLVRYTGTFSIFDNDDKDKKLASERLLYYMVAQDDFEDGEIQNYPLVLSSNGLEAATAISGQRSLEKMIKEIQTPCIMLNTNDGKINEK
ncbi:serine/threonine protein kinase [Clostridium sp. AM27-31LB]|jgi:serine/threonine protein kinase|uniref:serine/threonine protein kinase n=1 Tax=Clostridia TaxID=186801 RepID=UPI000E47576A|nr:serine/threonine-protein kinase [Clostridium sp. AM27-31LB]MBS5364705.1 serine/threonine protein kinase [Clostridium sp.]MCQ5166773.1 serine/threonine protein kinase [Roseburia hominis]RHT95892.1 serine/threonine protein kinase [Clostridium sp. AM27-31LB]